MRRQRVGIGVALARDKTLPLTGYEKSGQTHVHDGKHAIRLIDSISTEIFIDPSAIDRERNLGVVPDFHDHRLTATIEHVTIRRAART